MIFRAAAVTQTFPRQKTYGFKWSTKGWAGSLMEGRTDINKRIARREIAQSNRWTDENDRNFKSKANFDYVRYCDYDSQDTETADITEEEYNDARKNNIFQEDTTEDEDEEGDNENEEGNGDNTGSSRSEEE